MRRSATLIALLLLITLVAACGGGAESTTTVPEEPSTTTTVTEEPNTTTMAEETTTTTMAEETTTTTVAVPTAEELEELAVAEELAARLLTATDLGAGWEDNPEWSGVVTEEMRQDPPYGAEYCPEADPAAVDVANELRWLAFTVLPQTDSDALRPPISVQEWVLAGDPAEIEASFQVLKAASMACSGSEWEMTHGGGVLSVTQEAMSVPEVGDDSFGEHSVAPEGIFRWDIRSVLVRDGAVLILINEVEIIGIDDDMVMSQEELDTIVTTACEKLAA